MRDNRICSIKYINSQMKLNLLCDVDAPPSDGDLLQWNESTQLWETTQNPSAPADGIFGHWDRDDASDTLTPALAGDNLTIGGSTSLGGAITWLGNSEAVLSDAAKKIDIGTSIFQIVNSSDAPYFKIGTSGNIIDFGNATVNPVFQFLGSGSMKVESLSPSLGVYTTAGQVLTSTAPTSGDLGFWNRTVDVLSPVGATDDVELGGDVDVTGLSTLLGGVRTDSIGPDDGLDDDLIQLSLGQVDINGDLVISESLPTITFNAIGSSVFNTRFQSTSTQIKVETTSDSGSTWDTTALFNNFNSFPVLNLRGLRGTIKLETIDTTGGGIAAEYFQGYVENDTTSSLFGKIGFFGSLNQGGTPIFKYNYISSGSAGNWNNAILKLAEANVAVNLSSSTIPTTANFEVHGDSVITTGLRIGDLAAPAVALDVVGESALGDGGTTNYLSVSATGDTKYNGSAKALNLSWDTETFTANDTLDTENVVALIDASSNSVAITLPTAVGIQNRVYYIKAIDASNPCTVVTNGSQTIDGDTGWTLSGGESITIVSDNANWWII